VLIEHRQHINRRGEDDPRIVTAVIEARRVHDVQ
jgi:hypothetical protein